MTALIALLSFYLVPQPALDREAQPRHRRRERHRQDLRDPRPLAVPDLVGHPDEPLLLREDGCWKET